jgi:hypothetical protein
LVWRSLELSAVRANDEELFAPKARKTRGASGQKKLLEKGMSR